MNSPEDENGPADGTRSRTTFAPYNITSAQYAETLIRRSAGRSVPLSPIATGVDLSPFMRDAVTAEDKRLDDDGEDADGHDITLLPNPAPPKPLPHFSPSLLLRTAYDAIRRVRTYSRRTTIGRRSTGGRPPPLRNLSVHAPSITAPPVLSRPVLRTTSPGSLPFPRPQPSASTKTIEVKQSSLSQRITRSFSRSMMTKKRSRSPSVTRRTRLRVEEATTTHDGSNAEPSPRIASSSWGHTNGDLYDDILDGADDKESHIWTREELLADGFRLIEWDGIEPKVILDSEDRIVTILAGRPDDRDWDRVVLDGLQAMQDVRGFGESNGDFRMDDLNHPRGDFITMVAGVSYGGAQRTPGNLVQPEVRQRMLHHLLSHASFVRFAGFHNSCMVHFAPKVYKDYVSELKPLWDRSPDLSHNFPNSIFPAVMFDCGPQTVALKHVYSGNVAGGLSAITALGLFDPKVSGLLVLFPFKMVIEFPSGATVLLPSSVVHHANTALQPGELRCSMTQYCAGGLFRWVDYGFKSAKTLISEKGGKNEKKRIDSKEGGRWKRTLNLFSKIGELAADRKRVFEVPGTS